MAVHLGVDTEFLPAKKAHPAFRCSDYNKMLRRLEAWGVTIVSDEILFEGMVRCYIADPFGNRIELIAEPSHPLGTGFATDMGNLPAT